MKICARCDIAKDEAMFPKNKRYSDGMWPYCRSCECQRAAEYRKRNPEKVKLSQKQSRLINAERIAEKKKARQANNPEKFKAARKAAYEKNKESELAKAKAWKLANKEKLSRQAKEWLAENGAINRFYRSERRAAEKKAKPIWYDKSKTKAMYSDAAEFTELTGYQWHVDHIVPLKSDLVCGLHWHGNTQVISASSNQSKSNRYWPDMP